MGAHVARPYLPRMLTARLSADPALAPLVPRLAFALEIDRLKGVERRDVPRVLGRVLADLAPPGTDVDRVVRMLLVHDLVEIDAGDTFAFDAVGLTDRDARELSLIHI